MLFATGSGYWYFCALFDNLRRDGQLFAAQLDVRQGRRQTYFCIWKNNLAKRTGRSPSNFSAVPHFCVGVSGGAQAQEIGQQGDKAGWLANGEGIANQQPLPKIK
jgi:hypothetical protein